MLCGSIGARQQSKLPRMRLPTASRNARAQRGKLGPASNCSKSRRKRIAEVPARMERARTRDKRRFPLRDGGVGNTAIDRAYHRALLTAEKPNALAALVGRDVIDVLPERRMLLAVELPLPSALVNRAVGACRQAKPAIDAVFGNQRRHLSKTERSRSPKPPQSMLPVPVRSEYRHPSTQARASKGQMELFAGSLL